MLRFALNRLAQGIVTLLVTMFIVFYLADQTGDPARFFTHPEATAEQQAYARNKMGLDKPLHERYGLFLWRAMRADLGNSFQQHNSPVRKMIMNRVPITLQLAGVVFGIVMVTAIPLGVLSAVKRGSWIDTIAKSLAILGQSVPQFWLGIMLMLLFGVVLGILPIAGRGSWMHFILPGITGAWFGMAGLLRLTRSSMLEVLNSDYVRTARAKGLAESVVVWVHTFRNALIPIITYSAILLAGMLNGFLVIEVVFAWQGLGSITVNAATTRDFPTLYGMVMYIIILYLVVNFLVDVLYGYIDPRIRYA
jgi:peptide/nickel transport system permease protein